MDTIKFALVIGLPDIQTFGYLIIASVGACALGGVFFTAYAISDGSRENKSVDDDIVENNEKSNGCDNKAERQSETNAEQNEVKPVTILVTDQNDKISTQIVDPSKTETT